MFVDNKNTTACIAKEEHHKILLHFKQFIMN